MPDGSPYQVARTVASRLAEELRLSPPFDVDRVAVRHAELLDAELPTRADAIVLHGERAGERPRIIVDSRLAEHPARRRFAVAHALGHVLLGWHPFGSSCDVSDRPHELPITVHDLVEGEANAFARELLLPRRWIAAFDALDRPAELVRLVAARGGVLPMPAARAVALQLPAGWVWTVTDQWRRVLDAGRSPGTAICSPTPGTELEPAPYARAATERHRDQSTAGDIWFWRFEPSAVRLLPHDRSSHAVAEDIATDLQLGPDGARAIVARIEGVAGWANEQADAASLDGMERTLEARARSVASLQDVAAHPEFEALIRAKATELVAKRLAR